MGLAEWIAEFKKLHEAAKSGELSPEDWTTYQSARDEFGRAMVSAQRMSLQPGQLARHSFRVARALQIDLAMASGNVRAMTLNISVGGFAALLAGAPPPAEAVGFTLKTPGKADPILGRCKVVEVHKRPGNALVSFAFQALSSADLDRLDRIVLDAALEQFSSL
jgi:PilZ domain